MLLRAIKRKGYRLPTPIQRKAMPHILQVRWQSTASCTLVVAVVVVGVLCWGASRLAQQGLLCARGLPG